MEYWIWLSFIEKNNYKQIQRLLEIYKTPQKIWGLEEKDLIKNGIDLHLILDILNPQYRRDLSQYLLQMKKENIHIVTIEDPSYPKKLKNIYDYPSVIYVKGNKTILNNLSIAIVGCREASGYGEYVAKKMAYELSKRGMNIISGLAKGIDTFAHMGCLMAKGKTIAVLGSGIDYIYPKENKNLVENILKSDGAIISEYMIGTEPSKYTFPARNRIISGIADGVLIVEAKEKSGSLITADFGLEQGKNVYAIPGNITSLNSRGTNNLMKEGAKPITCIQDILEDFLY